MTITKEIVILVGPPGSGKTTTAEGLMSDAWDVGIKTSRISQDDQGKQGHMDLFESALKNEIPLIIVDRMGFSKDQRDRYIIPARKAGYKVKIIVHHVPHQVCYDRMMARENHPTINGEDQEKSKIAKSALGTFFKQYQRVTDDEADVVLRYGWESEDKQKAVVFDIDGTIADIEHRRHHVQRTDGKKKDWRMFNLEMVNDTPKPAIVELVKAMATVYPAIVFCSGRTDDFRGVTYDWLEKTLNEEVFFELYMRRRDDSRQDNIVKEIILDFELLPRYDILFVVDDRDQVVKMWRNRGITCLQCEYGDF